MADVTAIDTARAWMASATANMGAKQYAIALYSMEMAVEIGLKAVLIAFGINVPKLHNVRSSLMALFDERRRSLPKEFVEKEDFILDTYRDLLEIRPMVGYTFEVNASVASKERAEKYLPMAKEVVDLCGTAAKRMRKGGVA